MFELKTTDSRTFLLLLDGEPHSTMHFPKWHSNDAEIKTNDCEQYDIAFKGIFSNAAELKRGNEVLMSLRFSWTLNGTIQTHHEGNSQTFSIVETNLWKSEFALQDAHQKPLWYVRAGMSLTGYDFSIRLADGTTQELDFLLLYLSVYYVRYYLNAMAGGV